MTASDLPPLSKEELAAEAGSALPDKEVMSLLDLNADLNLALDVAAPIDLAVAANANVAAPINAAVGANVLSVGSADAALAHQDVNIDQGLSGYGGRPRAAAQLASTRPTPATGTTPPATGVTRRPPPVPRRPRPRPSVRARRRPAQRRRQPRRGRRARRPDRRRGRGERQRRRTDRRLRVGQRRLRRLRRRPPSPTRRGRSPSTSTATRRPTADQTSHHQPVDGHGVSLTSSPGRTPGPDAAASGPGVLPPRIVRGRAALRPAPASGLELLGEVPGSGIPHAAGAGPPRRRADDPADPAALPRPRGDRRPARPRRGRRGGQRGVRPSGAARGRRPPARRRPSCARSACSARADGTEPELRRANPLLALRLR